MKQYCRYCSHLCTGNGIWCGERQKELSEGYTKRPNTCKQFCFVDIDAYDLVSHYTPRQKRYDEMEDAYQEHLDIYA